MSQHFKTQKRYSVYYSFPEFTNIHRFTMKKNKKIRLRHIEKWLFVYFRGHRYPEINCLLRQLLI